MGAYICLKENWWVPNFAFIKISILKSLNFLVKPSLIRRHSELLGIEILLNTQTPENDNFYKKSVLGMWRFAQDQNLECDDVIWKHSMFLVFHVFLNTQDNFLYETMQGFGHWSFAPYPKTMNVINFEETTCTV